MIEIKRRVAIFDHAFSAYAKNKVISVANLELGALQIRKCYELIAFASLGANRVRYSELRSAYEKDWNISDITRTIQKFNPDFLPVAISEVILPGDDIPNIVDDLNKSFTRKVLVSQYGQVSTILHAASPYAVEPDWVAWHEKVFSWRHQIVVNLSNHRATVEPGKVFFRTCMNTVPSGDIQVVVLERME